MTNATKVTGWKVQTLGASGKWICGVVHATRSEALADAASRNGRTRIKAVRS